MANLDSSTGFSKRDITSLVIEFGDASTVTLTLTESTISWSETGEAYADVKENGQHLSTPQARMTDDSDVEWSLDVKIASWQGDSNIHPYEAFMFRGNAAAKTSVGNGDKKMFKMTITCNSTGGGGGSQTGVLAYCICEKGDFSDQNGLIVGSFSGKDKENYITWS